MSKLLRLFLILPIYFLINGCESSNSFDITQEEGLLQLTSENEPRELNTVSSINDPFSFLALGDSYTIGESVEENERWPNQFIDYAQEYNVYFENPKIIAETGWKSNDLIDAIKSTNFDKKYDYISLLIGVNNQFNSRPIDEFNEDLNKLLNEINYLRKASSSIIIISIPDWGYTPFGEGYNRSQISNEINQFNNVLKRFATNNDFNFVDVTEISRKAISETDLIANDNLHPSGLMYSEWVEKIFQIWID